MVLPFKRRDTLEIVTLLSDHDFLAADWVAIQLPSNKALPTKGVTEKVTGDNTVKRDTFQNSISQSDSVGNTR